MEIHTLYCERSDSCKLNVFLKKKRRMFDDGSGLKSNSPIICDVIVVVLSWQRRNERWTRWRGGPVRSTSRDCWLRRRSCCSRRGRGEKTMRGWLDCSAASWSVSSGSAFVVMWSTVKQTFFIDLCFPAELCRRLSGEPSCCRCHSCQEEGGQRRTDRQVGNVFIQSVSETCENKADQSHARHPPCAPSADTERKTRRRSNLTALVLYGWVFQV